MPKYRQASVDEFLASRKLSTRDGVVYRAAGAPKSFNAQERSQVFVMTDESVDSYGDIVKANGVDLYRFEKNPIALLNHQSMLILGTWSEVQPKPQRLEGKVTLAAAGTAPHVDMAFNLMSQGILRGASIGFMPTKLEMRLDDDGEPMWSYIINEWELYECSVVSIPANPAALARSAINGDDVRIARKYIEQVLDEWARTPEGFLIPRAEYEKAYQIVVQKVADDAVAVTTPIVLAAPTKDVEEKSVAPIPVPAKDLTAATAASFAKGIHADAGIELVRKDGNWLVCSISTKNVPLSIMLPAEADETAARAFGQQIVTARATKDDDGDCDDDPLDPEDPDEVPDEASSKADASWSCKASLDLPLDEDTSWDGAAARKAMLDDAGIGGDTPDHAKAARGFLAVDTANPDLRGSYKLPFASIVGGELKALASGIRAAASRVPDTDISDTVKAEAQAVITHYEGKMKPADGKAAKVPENKTGTIVVHMDADTTQLEAAAAKVDGIFTRLAKKFPMFFPKADEPERVEPNIVPITPPAPPSADEIAAARAKAAAAQKRLVEKGLIAA